MSETGNIEELAKRISAEIFKWLKWETCPIKDTDWECVSEKHTSGTHPSDVVFYYDEPYSGNRLYLNTDLKSYKKISISPNQIKKALISLSKAVECANISPDWQNKYLTDDSTSNVKGLLFIYNNDNKFDNDFSSYLSDITLKQVKLSGSNQIIIFGPDKIKYLLNLITDIKSFISEGKMPVENGYTFFYPELVLNKTHGNEWNQPATIELLTSPWLIVKHKIPNNVNNGYIIYYDRSGNTVDEFIYLLDSLSHLQLLLSDSPIDIRLIGPCNDAKANYLRAKDSYLNSWGLDEARKNYLNRINVHSINIVHSEYNPMEIGMER